MKLTADQQEYLENITRGEIETLETDRDEQWASEEDHDYDDGFVDCDENEEWAS